MMQNQIIKMESKYNNILKYTAMGEKLQNIAQLFYN